MKTAIAQAKKEIAELWSSPSDTPTYTQIFEVLDRIEKYVDDGWISIQSEKDLPRGDSNTFFEICINGVNAKYLVNEELMQYNRDKVNITHYKPFYYSDNPLHK